MGFLETELTKAEPEFWGFPGVAGLIEHAKTDADRALVKADRILSGLIPELLQEGANPEQLWALCENYGAIALELGEEITSKPKEQ